jgi:hypothetical protein
VWPQLFESHIGVEDSFNYIVARTLMRPRDLLGFIQRCVEVALNRGHDKVSADDILQAERAYSDDALVTLSYEVHDSFPELAESLYRFHGSAAMLTRDEVIERLLDAGVTEENADEAVELLVWFDFLGVTSPAFQEEMYSYSVKGNIRRLLYEIERGGGLFVIHPAFRAALDAKG